MDWSKLIRWVIASSIFIGVLIGVEVYLGWLQVLQQWQHVSVGQLLLLTLVTFISYWLRAWRIYYYFGKYQQHNFSPYIRINLLHNALNNFLPMRLGEASFPLFMKQSFGFPILKSSAGLLAIRLFDLHWLLVLLVAIMSVQFSAYFLLCLPVLALMPFVAVKCFHWFKPKLPTKISQKLALLDNQSFRKHAHSNRVFLVSLYLQTAVIWSVKLFALCLILLFFIPLDFSQALLAVISADLSSILPIHGIAGSGTFEAAILAALLPLGINQQVILTAAVNLHIYVLLVTLLSVPVALLFKQK